MRLQHDYEELGFFLAIDRDRNGNIIRRIERGGPADRAGLRDGDRILGKLLLTIFLSDVGDIFISVTA